MTDKIYILRITHGQLAEVLTRLGYALQDSERGNIYTNEAYDSWIGLPRLPMDTIVRPAHMVAVRAELDGMGVVPREKFNDLFSSLPRIRKANGRTAEGAKEPVSAAT